MTYKCVTKRNYRPLNYYIDQKDNGRCILIVEFRTGLEVLVPDISMSDAIAYVERRCKNSIALQEFNNSFRYVAVQY